MERSGPNPRDLPVWQLHSEIVGVLNQGCHLVLVAATGSGKTTQVPQMLLDGGLAGERKIVVLQPRRVAARSVATRVAWERGCALGTEIGYQVRFEDHISPETRICFVTEGILLRWLQDDPELRDIGILIFDEFHERNLLSDVALALAKHLQRTRRPDLKLVVMSATLEAEPVVRYLAPSSTGSKQVPVLTSEGRTFPVDIQWAEYGDRRPVQEQAADAVERIIREGAEGDILVFMPGMGEILSTLNALRSSALDEHCVLLPLHGDLPAEEQDRAFQSFPNRKVVVATNVAETSITIDGIRHVVDAGLARVARYEAERGIQTLTIEPISRASADQRAGRAGRTAPGICWRLWTESAHLDRPSKNTPEIQRADLAEVVLLLHSLGIRKASQFDWLDCPEIAAVERAEQLLITLGALIPVKGEERQHSIGNSGSDLTPIGRKMLRLPMHPRYSRMLVEASRRNCVPSAALCAALTGGRDLLVRLGREDGHIKEARELFEASRESDFHTLMRAFQFARNAHFEVGTCRRHGIHAQTARQVEDTYGQLMSIAEREKLIGANSDFESESIRSNNFPASTTTPERRAQVPDPLLYCIAAGFVDQLAIRKDSGTLECQLTGNRLGTLVRESVVDSPLLVAAGIRETDGRNGRLTLLTLATTVQVPWLREMYPQHFSERHACELDRLHKRVAAFKEIRFMDLVLARETSKELDPTEAGRILAEGFASGWFELPNLDHRLRQLITRVNLLALIAPELEVPALDSSALRVILSRAFHGMTLIKEAQAADLTPSFHAHLQPAQQGFLDELLPLSIEFLGHHKVKLTYPEPSMGDADNEPGPPQIQVKLSECFGLKEHPTIAEGRVAISLMLMAPDQKRVATTTDFPNWRLRAYPALRSQLKAKYPGFLWP